MEVSVFNISWWIVNCSLCKKTWSSIYCGKLTVKAMLEVELTPADCSKQMQQHYCDPLCWFGHFKTNMMTPAQRLMSKFCEIVCQLIHLQIFKYESTNNCYC